MRFETLIVRNVLRRRIRSLLTVAGVAVAVGTVVALVGVAGSFERSFREVYERRGIDLIVVRAGAAQRLNSVLDESLGPRIAGLPGVRRVVSGLFDVVAFEDRNLYGVLVLGWEADAAMVADLQLVAGRFLTADDRRKVLLGRVLAKNLGLEVGQTLEVVEGAPFEVVGVYESFSVYENGGMVVRLGDLQKLMGREGQVTGFAVILDQAADPEAVAHARRQIEGLAPSLAALPAAEQSQSSTPIRMARGMARVTSLVALAIGALGMLNTMIVAVVERTREIGVLRALGWRQGRVARLVLGEALVLAGAGAALGTLLGLGAVKLVCLLPQVSGFLAGQIAPAVYLQAWSVALGLAVLGGIYPALRAARLLPTEAMRR